MELEMGGCKPAGSASHPPAKVNQIGVRQPLLGLPPRRRCPLPQGR